MSKLSNLMLISALLIVATILPGNVAAAVVALVADRIIDGNSKTALTNSAIVVDGETIVSVGSRNSIPDGMPVINLGDATLMPGMLSQ